MASVIPFIGKIRIGPLVPRFVTSPRAKLGVWRCQAPETQIFHLHKFVDSMA